MGQLTVDQIIQALDVLGKVKANYVHCGNVQSEINLSMLLDQKITDLVNLL